MYKLTVDPEIRLCLVDESFIKDYVRLLRDNFEHLAEWLQWPRICQDGEGFRSFIRASKKDYNAGKAMHCTIQYNGESVGNIGFNRIDHTLKKAEVGYWLAQSAQGQGIITRSCRFLINFAFHELALEKVEISAARENKASRAVCERLGMQLEGIITNSERVGNRILDHAIYGISKNELR